MCLLIWKLPSKTFPERKNGKKKKNKEEEKGELNIMLLIAWLRPISPFVRKHFMDSVDLMPHSHTSLVAF